MEGMPLLLVSCVFECSDEFGSPRGTDGLTTGAKILGHFCMRALNSILAVIYVASFAVPARYKL